MNGRDVPADPLQRLCALLGRLPGIGDKTALRLALAIVKSDPEYVRALSDALGTVHNTLQLCSQCCDLTPQPVCERCTDAKRDHTTICVVAQPQDRMAIERSGVYRGLYHVLHGVISPINGVGPDQLKLKELFSRLDRPDVVEMVVATNPTLEGEATAMYIRRHQGRDDLKVTHLARGLPVGGSLEYTDETTLTRAFQGRQEI